MIQKEDIVKYGGKAAALNQICSRIPKLPVPPYVVKQYEQPIDTILSDFQSIKKPVIVRSSSPLDLDAFDGIHDSVPNVTNQETLERAVRKVEASAFSERARVYAAQNGYSIDDRMHIIIQEQSPSVYNGAMMRHPNNPDFLFITLATGDPIVRKYSRIVWNDTLDSKANISDYFSTGIPDESARFLADKYREIEILGDIAKGFSLIVEFGFNPFAVYQVKIFKKITTADFDVPYVDESRRITTDFAFGITPNEGIVFPIIRGYELGHEGRLFPSVVGNSSEISFKGHDLDIKVRLRNLAFAATYMGTTEAFNDAVISAMNNNLMLDKKANRPYCFIIPSAIRESYDVDLSIPQMRALVIGEADNFLVHGLMRLLRKAEVTLCIPVIGDNQFYEGVHSIEDKVRVISNGKQATVMKE